MATLVFSALGTLVGGPLGGAIGALVGHQIDGAIIGRGMREGPRLKELPVTTASYGAVVEPCNFPAKFPQLCNTARRCTGCFEPISIPCASIGRSLRLI